MLEESLLSMLPPSIMQGMVVLQIRAQCVTLSKSNPDFVVTFRGFRSLGLNGTQYIKQKC